MKSVFSSITNREQARKAVKQTGIGLLLYGVLQGGVFSLLAFASLSEGRVSPFVFIDPVLYGLFGLGVWLLKSRIAAVLSVLLAGLGVVATLLTIAGVANGVGTNVFVALLVLGWSVRGAIASFKLHGTFAESPSSARAQIEQKKQRDEKHLKEQLQERTSVGASSGPQAGPVEG